MSIEDAEDVQDLEEEIDDVVLSWEVLVRLWRRLSRQKKPRIKTREPREEPNDSEHSG